MSARRVHHACHGGVRHHDGFWISSIALNGPGARRHHAAVTAISMPLVPLRDERTEVDAELVERLRAGDRRAVEEVYVAHHGAIRRFAQRLVGDEASAEDIVHEAFLALPRAIRTFRGEGTLRAFLIGVAVNHSRRHIRSAINRRRATERLTDREQLAPRSIDGTDELVRLRLANALLAALDELPIDQRVVFVLCEVEQRTSVEVSAIVGAPEGTVRTRLFHAKRKLRELLEDYQ
jgi:RNA polymerase sigma-70 factor, ECF subfamily